MIKLFGLLLLLSACGLPNHKSKRIFIITDVSRTDTTNFSYYSVTEYINKEDMSYFGFVDTSGKFNAGDTLKFIK